MRIESPFRLAVVMPVWRRRRLLLLVLEHLTALRRRLHPRVDLFPVCVRSDGDGEVRLSDMEGCFITSAANSPLSKKFNEGYRAATELGADAAMLLGSDNFVTAAYVEEGIRQITEGCEFVSATGLYLLNARTLEAVHLRVRTMGAGSLVARSVLDRSGGRILAHDRDKGVDLELAGQLGRFKVRQVGTIGVNAMRGEAAILDVKSYRAGTCGDLVVDNLHSYETIAHGLRHGSQELDAGEFLGRYFPHVAGPLLNLQEPQWVNPLP